MDEQGRVASPYVLAEAARPAGVRSALGGTVFIARLAAAGTVAAALMALGAPAASAHVHGINPLRCTPAAPNAGGLQTNETPASATNGGPISGVIPVTMGGNVPLNGGGFDAAVCDE
jgi:hypothetical protein